MYFSNYEDYMRSVLGYPVNNSNTYQMYNEYDITLDNSISDLEELYPDIYKRLNPIIRRTCENCNVPVTKELLDNLTMQISSEVENIEDLNRQESKSIKEPIKEDRNRQTNPLLNDLIRILLLNNLIGRNRHPYRPPMSPPRPPYPGGPIRPPQPRDYYGY